MSFLLTLLGIALMLFLVFFILAFGVVRQVLRVLLGQGGAQRRQQEQTRGQQRTQRTYNRPQYAKPTAPQRSTIGRNEGTYVDFEEIK